MSKWWTGAALAALCLAPAGTGRAQYLPHEKAPAPPPDPLPFGGPMHPGPGPQQPPPGVPPASALSAGHGQKKGGESYDELGLPASVPGAFTDCCPVIDRACYLHLGGMALQRQRLGRSPIAHLSPTNLDTGDIAAPLGVAPVQDFNDLNPPMSLGGRGTVGYLWGCHAIEASGFFIPEEEQYIEVAAPGQLNTFISQSLFGLEGNNGMFLQSDRLRTTLTTQLGSGEVNYRYFDQATTEAELVVGVRYLDLQERLSLYSGDDDLTVRDVFGRADPFRQGTFTTRTHNRMYAGQVGFEWYRDLLSCVTFGCWAKAAVGVNDYDVRFRWTRGDGFVARDAKRSSSTLTHFYDGGAFFDFSLLERLRVRAGYQVLWVARVPEAVDQIDFDVMRVTGRKDDDGSILYHGPLIEVQMLF